MGSDCKIHQRAGSAALWPFCERYGAHNMHFEAPRAAPVGRILYQAEVLGLQQHHEASPPTTEAKGAGHYDATREIAEGQHAGPQALCDQDISLMDLHLQYICRH